MKRAREYSRVSHKDKERGISIDIQQRINAECAEREGWQLSGCYCDDGISAYNDQIAARPAFAQMLADARARQFDVLIVYKWDRLARKQVIFYQVLAELERLGIQVHAATESNDWLARGVSGLMAEQYSRMLSARMKDVRRWEASQGRHVGGVPWGFARIDGALIPGDLIRWPIRAFELYASRKYGFGTLAEQLAREGAVLDSGRPPTKFQIAEVLRNVVYIGKVCCGDAVFAGLHAPVIDDTTWQTVQTILAERVTVDRYRKVAVQPLLSGLARCAECGRPMWYSNTHYYQCSGRITRATACMMGSVRAAEVEDHLIESLGVLMGDPDALAMVATELDDVIAADAPAPIDTQGIQAKMRRIGQLYEDGLKSEDAYRRELAALRAQLEAAPAAVVPPNTTQILALLGDLPALLRAADQADRRAALHQVFASVVLAPHYAVQAAPRPSFERVLLVLDQKITDQWAGWALAPLTRILRAA